MDNTNNKSIKYGKDSEYECDNQWVIANIFEDRIVKISETQDAVRECQDIFSANDYAKVIINLDVNNRVINRVVFPLINKTGLHVRHLFKAALMCNAHSIIILMNQPEQYLYASEEDMKYYEFVKSVAKSLSVNVYDYIFFSPQGSFISIENENIGKPKDNSGFLKE